MVINNLTKIAELILGFFGMSSENAVWYGDVSCLRKVVPVRPRAREMASSLKKNLRVVSTFSVQNRHG